MADKTGIEWADATFNPITGCTKISAGCAHCYAERTSKRFRGRAGVPAPAHLRAPPARHSALTGVAYRGTARLLPPLS